MGEVHRAAAVGFDKGADAYERGRPGFPQAAVERLVEVLGLGPESVVVDLAAGTGKLTRLLVPTGAHVIGVEPVEGMRRKFLELLPEVPLAGGVAEALPLRDGSIDAVTVAQAFHWFDAPAAIAELHRVLRPGGGLALVWNVRDDSNELASALTGFFDRYRGSTPAFRDRAWERAFAETELFEPLEKQVFLHEQRLTRETFIDRAASVSFIAALQPDQREQVEAQLEELLPPEANEVSLPYRCEIAWADRRS